MDLQFTNFATSTIADVGGIGVGDLTVNVQPGEGALFPSAAGDGYFYVVMVKTTGAREIVKVTARATDALTIVRAQDNTSALVFAENDKIELRVTAVGLEEIYAASRDMDGEELVLDADGDTSITADTDDQIDVKCAAQDQVTIVDGTITVPDSVVVWNTVTRTMVKISPSGAANVDKSGLTAGAVYEVVFRLSLSSSGYIVLTFNADGGATYTDSMIPHGYGLAGSYYLRAEDNARANIRVGSSSIDYYMGKLRFSTAVGDDTIALVSYSLMAYKNKDNFYHTTGGGTYNGAANVTRMTLTPTAGTVTGVVTIERLL